MAKLKDEDRARRILSLEPAKNVRILQAYLSLQLVVNNQTTSNQIFTKNKVTTNFVIHKGGIPRTIPRECCTEPISFCMNDSPSMFVLIKPDRLCDASSFDEVIFKFCKTIPENRISLMDNAHFYTGFSGQYRSLRDFGIYSEEGKRPIDCLATVLKKKKKEDIHVAVDQMPRIRLMCTTDTWTLSFSLVLNLEKGLGVVALKGKIKILGH